MSRWLVIGAAGQLGTDLMSVLGEQAVGVDLPQIDITDPDSVAAVVAEVGPDIVVNCAAYTAVDDAETHEQVATAINGDGVAHIVAAARGCRLVQISTDYVFDGSATSPYPEDAALAPVSAYGRSKAAGERAVAEHPDAFIVRTAWLYGATGKNFVKTMLGLERTRETVSVVDDQVGQPTWSADLARQIVTLAGSDAAPGIYHGTNSGQTSWYGFTRRIYELVGADPDRVLPTTSADFQRPAPRPAFSVLGHDRWREAGLEPMRSWDQALDEALPAIIAGL